MREITLGLRLGVCLGVILLVLTDETTTSGLPEDKLRGLFKKIGNRLESSSFVVTALPSPGHEDQRKIEEENRSSANNTEEKKKEEEEEEEEQDYEMTTIEIKTTTIVNNGSNNSDTVDELEIVTSPVTIYIESTTSSMIFDNELESVDRAGTSEKQDKQNTSSYVEEISSTTTNMPPTTTIWSTYNSESTEKRTESNLEDTTETSGIVTTIRDTSIYENTIGRKDSDKKSIVTEPSVVLENSIQQQSSYKFNNNVTSESTSSTTAGTTEFNLSSTEGMLTNGTPFSENEKIDFTGNNGITENNIIDTQASTVILTSSEASSSSSSSSSLSSTSVIPETRTEAFSSNENITEKYSTVTSDSSYSTETTIESSDLTSIEPTNSSSFASSSSGTIGYEFVGLTESSANAFATTTNSNSIENTSIRPASQHHTLDNVSSSTIGRSLFETTSWPRVMTERTVPGTLSPSSSSTTTTTTTTTNVNTASIPATNMKDIVRNRATDDYSTASSTESIVGGITVESTTESLDPTAIVNVVTLDIPSSTFITTIVTSESKLPSGKKSSDVISTTEGPPSDEVTSLVSIILEGTWQDVCPRLEDFRRSLADLLSSGLDKSVYPKQIRFHRNPCNGPPTDETRFSIFVYVVDEDGKFDAETTKNLPNLYKSVGLNSPITIHSLLLVQENDSSNAIAVVVVSSVAFICLLLLAGLLFVMRKRQTRFNYGERCRPVSLDAYSLDSVSAYNSVRRKGHNRSSKRSYGNPTFEDSSAIPSHPLNFAGLSTFSNDVDAINEEFAGIPQVSAKMDELPAGAEIKNRYANVIPLPESRVPLRKLNDDPLSEYINANYVRGPKNATKYYIACQAPLDTTVTDFWRMVWEQQCKVIIMLTDFVENGVEKCTEYVPPSEVTDCHRLYGDFQVTLKKRETKEKYAISTLHLKNLENNTFREVYHIWYLWPTSGVQSDGAGLIAVLLEARALQRGGPGPIVVHCSPGTGRTGTLIALDLGIRQYEITRTVDVPRVVYTIRRDRAGAVQTKEQYAFIYKALNLYATKLAGGMLESS